MKIIMILLMILLSGCSAQYTYHHGDCDITIDSLRDLPEGVNVKVGPDCNVTVEAGQLRNGSSETIQILNIVSGIIQKIK